MRSGLRLMVCLLLGAAVGRAADPELAGVLRLAGNPEMTAVVGRWTAAFQKAHPMVRVETHLTGSDTGMAALYTGRTDLALLGRAPTLSEIQAFEWIFHYKPAQVEIMTGSLDRAGKSPALVLFVHRDNPLKQLTLAQLDAIFGTEHRLSSANIRTWGQLGMNSPWANRPIALYAPDAMSGTGRFFRHTVLNDSRMMNWTQLTEFCDTAVPLERTHDAGRLVLAALAKDRYGLGVASLGFTQAGVRLLPIVVDGTPVAATRENLVSRRYPLTRSATAYLNRKPGTATDPLVAEFLRYVLSREGQREAVEASAYLPLTAELATEQVRRLD